MSSTKNNEIGFVTKVKSYLITLEGLPSARSGDLIISEDGTRAIVTTLIKYEVHAMTLDPTSARPGERFTLTGKDHLFSLGDHLLGRVINTLGDPIDEKTPFPKAESPFAFDFEATGISSREHIQEQFITGIMMIDMLLPLAKGQRQLIFGPSHSGKSLLLRNTIAHQRDSNIVCIYAIVGQPATVVPAFTSHMYGEKGNPSTITVSASSDEPTSRIVIAPAVAMSIAEHFREKGREVLLVIDDFAVHAKYVREMALLEERVPGRESYPGDIFYQHARIIERAGNFQKKVGGGSITLLPVLETEIENYSDLIPTNLMAATDGHLMFSESILAQGIYPPISEEESVTRVGRNAQSHIQKQLAEKVLALLAQYRQEREYTQFGAPTSPRTEQILKQGNMVRAMLLQEPDERLSLRAQIGLLSLVFTSFSKTHEVSFFEKNRTVLIKAFQENQKIKELENVMTSIDVYLKELNSKIPIIDELCTL
jgi:F-type H+/Na+-transporting ATPase subunit alpha